MVNIQQQNLSLDSTKLYSTRKCQTGKSCLSAKNMHCSTLILTGFLFSLAEQIKQPYFCTTVFMTHLSFYNYLFFFLIFLSLRSGTGIGTTLKLLLKTQRTLTGDYCNWWLYNGQGWRLQSLLGQWFHNSQ